MRQDDQEEDRNHVKRRDSFLKRVRSKGNSIHEPCKTSYKVEIDLNLKNSDLTNENHNGIEEINSYLKHDTSNIDKYTKLENNHSDIHSDSHCTIMFENDERQLNHHYSDKNNDINDNISSPIKTSIIHTSELQDDDNNTPQHEANDNVCFKSNKVDKTTEDEVVDCDNIEKDRAIAENTGILDQKSFLNYFELDLKNLCTTNSSKPNESDSSSELPKDGPNTLTSKNESNEPVEENKPRRGRKKKPKRLGRGKKNPQTSDDSTTNTQTDINESERESSTIKRDLDAESSFDGPESPKVKQEVKKRKYNKHPKSVDGINLYKKATRHSESFYEMQLRLAIEMSMRDFQPPSESVEPISDRVSELSEELDSEYEDSKPKTKAQKSIDKEANDKKKKGSKATKVVNKRKNSKKDEESKTIEPATPTSSTSASLSNGTFSTKDDSSSTSFENSIELKEFMNDKTLSSSLPSDSTKSETLEDLAEQTMSQAKMSAFEEYLSMCEKFYCGRPLVDDLLVYRVDSNVNVSGGINKRISAEIKSQKSKNSDKDSDSSSSSGREQNLQKDGKLINWSDKSQEDQILRFNCSNLDLLYRVSFNILRSPHRQPEVIDLWGPKELVLFELGLFKYGKLFHEIQRDIPSKSVKEIVDMYYLWKKSNRYKLWKANRYY